MLNQLLFGLALLVTLGVFTYTVLRLAALFRLTRKAFPITQIGARLGIMFKTALGQDKILRKPWIGLMHALVFWGFCVILIGSVEMVIDGIAGTERILGAWGVVYDILVASGDIFAAVILILVIAFLIRRLFLPVKRFEGIEMSHRSHVDANVSLTLILLLMVTLLGMNGFYSAWLHETAQTGVGVFPVSQFLTGLFDGWQADQLHLGHEISWWSHILLIFIFANYLPYSKHFHVFLSVPNVFLSDLAPLGKLTVMDTVLKEVKLMMDPSAAADDSGEETDRFGIMDVEDVTWKNYLDSLACTQCGRCTSVCPANITGKKLSPRKIMMDLRARMDEKGRAIRKNGKGFDDARSLLKDFISTEELWACTTCNACARECPINIDQPSLIVDMRRYLVMEEAAAPAELNAIFSNIENNGAPWQFSPDDRLNWVEEEVPVMADLAAKGEKPEYLFWVGSAGAFDDRYKKVTRAFIRILRTLNCSFAVLGPEESSSGDVARRAGNEMLFMMQALNNIDILKGYGVTKILTCDPHAYNTFLNEYPDLDGHFQVIHHTQFLQEHLRQGSLKLPSLQENTKVTYHDPCYLGRANGVYEPAREVIGAMTGQLVEMKRSRSFALCCGAGGGQMFKEAEPGNKEVFLERTEEVLALGAKTVVTACPYCMVMLTDGMKYKNMEKDIRVRDLAELVDEAMNIESNNRSNAE